MNQHIYSSEPTFKTLDDIKNKKVTIMGLGLNGGGEASVRFFSKYGAFITITDMKTQEQLATTIESIEKDDSIDKSQIRYVLGKHEISDFENADVVIKNPGVKYDGNIYLQAAKNIETDLSIFLYFSKAPIIAVTGSKGKSSTVSAIHYGLCKAGFKAFLGGNITVSPLTFLEQTNKNTPVVLELSSWQLSDLRGRKLLKPIISAITKIVPDHQNWYGNMHDYVEDKKLIFADQTTEDYTICDFNDDWGRTFARETKGTVAWYSKEPFPDFSVSMKGAWLNSNKKGYVLLPHIKREIMSVLTENPLISQEMQNTPQEVIDELLVPGTHMKENLLIAALIMTGFGLTPEHTKEILKDFPGIPHRLEFCNSWTPKDSNIEYRFYNDSAATVPEATVAALESFSEPIHLICGGTDKGLDFTELAKKIDKATTIWFLEGTGTDKLLSLIDKEEIVYNGPFSSLKDLLLAFNNFAQKKEAPNKTQEIIVFSPGATSFGMFKNEFDRGNNFKQKISDLFN